MMVTISNALVGVHVTAGYHIIVTLAYMSLVIVGGIVTGLGFICSAYIHVVLHEWIVNCGVSPTLATACIIVITWLGSFGFTPINHGIFERGSDDRDLKMELLPNLMSKALIPFNTKMEMLH